MMHLIELPERTRRRAGQMLAGTGPADETWMLLEVIGGLLGSE